VKTDRGERRSSRTISKVEATDGDHGTSKALQKYRGSIVDREFTRDNEASRGDRPATFQDQN